jgi:hypothetical protein
LLLGDPEKGQRVVFTGAAIEDAKRASRQAGQGEIWLDPSSGGRLDVEHVTTQPSLPTPAMTQLDTLLMAPEPVELRTTPSVSPFSTSVLHSFLAPELRRVLREENSIGDFRKLSMLEIVTDGLDPASSGS